MIWRLSKLTCEQMEERRLEGGHLLKEGKLTKAEIARSKGKTQLFSKKTPGIEHYLSISAGKRGISYVYIITTEGARIELYIDNGDRNWNKRVFDILFKSK